MILVSVLMTTYNHERFIAQAIESVLQQKTNFRFELIIADDASTDRNQEIIRDYQQTYPEIIRTILRPSNLGGQWNFRDAVNHCIGKYIALCDGDDYWNSTEKMQQQVDLLESNLEFGLIFSNYDVCGRSMVVHKVLKFNPNYSLHPENLLVNNSISTCTVMCRRDLFLQGMEFLGDIHFAMGDYPIWLYIAQKSKLVFIDKSLSTYRIVGGSATNQSYDKQLNFLESQHDVKQLFTNKYLYPRETIRNAEQQYLKKKLLLCFLMNRKNDLFECCDKLILLVGKLTLKERLYCIAIKSSLMSWPVRQYHEAYHWFRRH